jgi:hypothetical protein
MRFNGSNRQLLLRAVLTTGLCALALTVQAVAEEQGLLAGWGLGSKYVTGYRVTKRETDWRQTMTLTRQGQLSNLSAELHSKNREDEARSDFEEALNRLGLRVGRSFGFGEAFVEGRTRRHWSKTTRSRTDICENTAYLGSTLPFLKRESGRVEMTFRGGWVQEEEIRKQSRRGLIVDSTLATGWSGKMELGGDWEPNRFLAFGGNVSYDGSAQESRSVHWEVDEEGSISDAESLSDTDNARTSAARCNLIWSRLDACKVAVNAGYSNGYAQFYQPTERTQETQSIVRQSAGVSIEGDVTETLNYGVDFSSSLSEFDYEVQTKDRLDSNQSLSFRARHAVGIPLLAGATLTAGASFTGGRRSVQHTTAYDTKGKVLEGDLQKPLGNAVTIGARMAVNLTQDFYDDGSLDKDRLRSDVSLVASYSPSPAFRANGGYSANTTEIVNIAADRSPQNQIQRNYQVTASYNTTLPGNVALRQSFLISAAYTYYVFNEDENTLTRTNRVTTKINVPLWELRQNLKAAAQYDISRMIAVRATETYDLNYRTALATGITTRRDKLEFSGEIEIRKEFSGGLKVGATFEKTTSTTEEDYWNIHADVEKRFD